MEAILLFIIPFLFWLGIGYIGRKAGEKTTAAIGKAAEKSAERKIVRSDMSDLSSTYAKDFVDYFSSLNEASQKPILAQSMVSVVYPKSLLVGGCGSLIIWNDMLAFFYIGNPLNLQMNHDRIKKAVKEIQDIQNNGGPTNISQTIACMLKGVSSQEIFAALGDPRSRFIRKIEISKIGVTRPGMLNSFTLTLQNIEGQYRFLSLSDNAQASVPDRPSPEILDSFEREYQVSNKNV